MKARKRFIALSALLALVLAIPATSYSTSESSSGGVVQQAKKKKKKKCKKGYVKKKVKNKKGKKVKKCVKKKKKKAKKLSGLAPADGTYISGSGRRDFGPVAVYVSGNRTRITSEVKVPKESQTCLPSNSGSRGDQLSKVVGMALNAKTGEFSGADQFGAGSGPSAAQGKFLSHTKLRITGSVSGRTNAVNSGDRCQGSATYTVTLHKR